MRTSCPKRRSSVSISWASRICSPAKSSVMRWGPDDDGVGDPGTGSGGVGEAPAPGTDPPLRSGLGARSRNTSRSSITGSGGTPGSGIARQWHLPSSGLVNSQRREAAAHGVHY
jgi:hypothetical protein